MNAISFVFNVGIPDPTYSWHFTQYTHFSSYCYCYSTHNHTSTYLIINKICACISSKPNLNTTSIKLWMITIIRKAERIRDRKKKLFSHFTLDDDKDWICRAKKMFIFCLAIKRALSKMINWIHCK